MTNERTAPRTRITENYKARFRLPLLALMTIVFPSVTGVRSTGVWIVYALSAMVYSLWTLHLTTHFPSDRRVGYLLCLTDAAVLLPLFVWGADLGLRLVILLVCGAGFAITYVVGRTCDRRRPDAMTPARSRDERAGRLVTHNPEMVLELAVRYRLGLLASEGTRFGLVILRVLRYDEAAAYYGPEVAARMVSAVGRRGVRHLGTGADLFSLGHGRVAFLFDIEESPSRSRALAGEWSEPYDVEGMAMKLARRTCERLIEGHRAECVVGWASAPADGLNADDLLYAAENGTRSAEAFRRVGGARVAVRVVSSSGPRPRRVSAAVPDEARTAVG